MTPDQSDNLIRREVRAGYDAKTSAKRLNMDLMTLRLNAARLGLKFHGDKFETVPRALEQLK